MPYRKRYYKKPSTKSGQTTKKLVKKEVKVQLNRQIESKYHDHTLAVSTIDYNGTIFNLTGGIVQGVDDHSYIGEKIIPSHLSIRANVVGVAATTMVRFIVFRWTQNNTPTAVEILQSVGNVRTPLSPYDEDFTKLYRVLFDRTYNLVLGTESNQKLVKISIPSKKMSPMYFQGPAGFHEKGGLYMLVISDTAANHPLVQYLARMFFKDA